jgi:GT2 family glycosyltransferase
MTSIIICTANDAKYRACEQMYARLFPAGSMEMVRIADARSLAEGYNRGVRAARGEHLIFVHDDVEILSTDLAEQVSEHLQEFDIIGLAGTSLLVHPMWLASGPPFIHGQVGHPNVEGGFKVDIYSASCRAFEKIEAVDGLFIAARRDAALKIGFDETVFDGFHLYDIDFTYRAHLAGLKVGVVCDIHALHHSTGQYDQRWAEYAERFQRKHQGSLPPPAAREFTWGYVLATNRDAIRAAMTPRTWGRS